MGAPGLEKQTQGTANLAVLAQSPQSPWKEECSRVSGARDLLCCLRQGQRRVSQAEQCSRRAVYEAVLCDFHPCRAGACAAQPRGESSESSGSILSVFTTVAK